MEPATGCGGVRNVLSIMWLPVQIQRDLADELEFEAGEIPESCWTGKKRLDKADDL
jgi:hypothetical protein